MLDDQVQATLAQLQKRDDGDKSSLFEHFSDMVINIMESAGQGVDLMQVSELVKKQALPAMNKDGLLPYRPQADTSEAKKALDLYGCAAYHHRTRTAAVRVQSPAVHKLAEQHAAPQQQKWRPGCDKCNGVTT